MKKSYKNCLGTVSAWDRLCSTDEKFSKYLSSCVLSQLLYSCEMEGDAENSYSFGKSMVWIGIYIANMLYGFQYKTLWFPCKYFSLNAPYIAVIVITMKLPVDLSSAMPSYVEQVAKL
ncbi:hypothetical protein HanXRQr2_Chr17g0788871 [Helianthus annuus]|uniref:Uncharacterized protein n=1 Tax=Helianthus annuus TaxID=4232 RepID=A0A9K3GTH0_HELAN|nr:hypothetical protein HanXRQr2_Chr17g0788871 [Helianthus annuus]